MKTGRLLDSHRTWRKRLLVALLLLSLCWATLALADEPVSSSPLKSAMMSAQLLLATDCSDTEKLGTITSLYREMFSSEYIRKHRPQGQETVEALLAMVQICPRFAACLRMDYYDDRAIVTQTRPLDSDLLREGEVCVGVPPNLPAWMEPAHYGTIERSFRDAVARLTIKKKLATQWERGFLC